MLNIENSLKKFHNLPPEMILTVDSGLVAAEMAKLEEKYGIKLSPLIIFITVGDLLVEEIEKYLKVEFGVDDKAAQAIKKDLMEYIIEPVLMRLNFFNANPNKEMTLKQEKGYVLEMLEKKLIAELNNNPIIIDKINSRIFNILSEGLEFKEGMEKALLKNKERITAKPLTNNGKKNNATAENWLNDFINVNGSGNFDNLALTKYLTTSANGKLLDPEEKKRVHRLLSLYRNIKFFPESMPSDDGTGWEIIPLEAMGENLGKARQVSGPPKTEEEMKIDELKAEEERYAQGGIERLALEEEVGKKKKVEDLKIEAGKYRDNSLEKKALLEEIKKLEK